MQSLSFFHSLKYRIAFFIGLTVALAMFAFAFLVRETVKPALYRVLEESAKDSTLLLEHIVAQEMLQESPHNIKKLLSSVASLSENENLIKLRITDEEMRIYFSSSPEEVGTNLDTSHQRNFFFSHLNKPAINYIRPIKAQPACLACHGSKNNEIGYLNVVLASAQLPVEKEVSHTRIFYLSLIIAASLFLTLWFYISRQVATPLANLANLMQRAEKGQLDIVLDFDSEGTEIDKLKEYFNHMVKSLNFYQRDLEDRIKLRTKELAEANLQLNKKITELSVIKSFNESVIQSLQGALITLNAQGEISFVNKKVYELLGYRDEEILGKPMAGFICKNKGLKCYANECLNQDHSEPGYLPFPVTSTQDRGNLSFCSAENNSCLLRRVFYEGKDLEGELELDRKDGSIFSAHLSLSNLVDSNGHRLGVTAIIRDLTKEKEMETSLKQLDRLTILGELTASLAHEIKNPLTGIQGALEVLDQYFQEGDVHKEISAEILSQFKRLDKVIMDLLRFSKIRKPDFDLVNLEEIMGISLFLVKKQLAEKKIELSQETPEDLPFVRADSEQLQQVFLNLLINAIQAVPEGGHIKISTEKGATDQENKNSNFLKITIQDDGMGISPENISKIFNPFFTTKPKGTGLGLSMVQNIIAQHQGRIEVKSQVKAGTTITLQFPIANNERV